MKVQVHDGAGALLAAAGGFLQADPFTANVIAVVAGRIAAGAEQARDEDLFATVEDPDGQVVGLAMRTPPHPLFISRMPGQAAAELAGRLAQLAPDAPGVNGEAEAAEVFAQAWCRATGRRSTLVRSMRMYRLGTLERPRGVSGAGRDAAAPDEIALVADWLAAFHREAQPHFPHQEWTSLAHRRVTAGEVHLWCDAAGTPVSLAAVSAPAAGVARIGPVYTPPQWRERGYGAAVTAEASAAALAGGAEHVVLYTDLANPTSNSIYQAIGYRPDHDGVQLSFR